MTTSRFQLIFIGVFVAFIIIGVILFAAGGRGRGEEGGSITVWGTMPQSVFSQIWGQSQLSKDQTLVVTYVEKSEENFDSDFVEALAEGVGPDVIFISHDNVYKNRNKLLTIPFESISERTYRDTFVEEGSIFLTPAGALALPVSIDPLVMYWNKNIFSDAGLASPPTFWDEYFALSGALTTKDSAFNVTRSTVALGEYKNISNSKEILAALIMQAGNPIVAIENGVATGVLRKSFNTPVLPTSAALSFYTEFSNPAKPFYSWNRSLPLSETAFLAGDLAVYFDFGSRYSYLKIKNPNLNFDIANFPQSRTGIKKITYGNMTGLAIVKNSQNIAGAFAFISELISKDIVKVMAESLGIAPARRDLLSERQTDAVRPVLYDGALWSQGWLDPDNVATDQIFLRLVESVTGGRVRMDVAINQAGAELENLFK
jgi:multiple sugar transport system substrate-binding protein